MLDRTLICSKLKKKSLTEGARSPLKFLKLDGGSETAPYNF